MKSLIIIVRGGGDIGSAVSWALCKANLGKIIIIEKEKPFAIRREVSFASAIYENVKTVEGITGKRELIKNIDINDKNHISVIIDEKGDSLEKFHPHVVIDAILSKRKYRNYNLKNSFIVGLGPEFIPGENCHVAVETNRGHNLGRAYYDKPPMKPTGIPGKIAGYSEKRLLRASIDGIIENRKEIGDFVEKGDVIAVIGNTQVKAEINGVLRGLIRNGVEVYKNLKIGDIDPRGIKEYCYTISEKSRCIAGSVVVEIMNRFF